MVRKEFIFDFGRVGRGHEWMDGGTWGKVVGRRRERSCGTEGGEGMCLLELTAHGHHTSGVGD